MTSTEDHQPPTSEAAPQLGSGAYIAAVLAREARDASRAAGADADISQPVWRQFVDAQQREEATGRPKDLVWEEYEQAALGAQMAADIGAAQAEIPGTEADGDAYLEQLDRERGTYGETERQRLDRETQEYWGESIPAEAVVAMRAELADMEHRNIVDPSRILDPLDISDAEILANIAEVYGGTNGSGVAEFVTNWHADQAAADDADGL